MIGKLESHIKTIKNEVEDKRQTISTDSRILSSENSVNFSRIASNDQNSE